MLIKEYTYSYKDVAIVPARWTTIEHRSECKILDEENRMPIFAAPMSSIINKHNFKEYENVGIIPILPRSESLEVRYIYAVDLEKWAAFSLDETSKKFLNNKALVNDLTGSKRIIHVLIDVANGHMRKLFAICKLLRRQYKTHIEIMIGNIANPQTYLECVEAGVDYVRCSIGTGDGCTTTTKTGIHYGIASLIDEIAHIKDQFHANKKVPKIIADGGIRDYDDVVKAIALGADYVMIGGLFATCKESCGDKYIKHDDGSFSLMAVDDRKAWQQSSQMKYSYFNSFEKRTVEHEVYTDFFGMASHAGQKAISGNVRQHSEGISKMKHVDKCLSTWVDEMKSTLASAMSYCNAETLKEFRYKTELKLVSPQTYNSVNRFN